MVKPLNRTRLFFARLRPYEHAQLRAAAALKSEPMSVWGRRVLLAAARRVTEQAVKSE